MASPILATRGWKYSCVVPKWQIGDYGDEGAVYYTVVVEMSSSKGYTLKRGMLRRFRDFIRLHQGLLGLGLNVPPPPPKLRLRAVNTSSALIEQRRRKLQEWLWSLVSIPRVAQSRPMALFLELEAHSVLLSEEEEANAMEMEAAATDSHDGDDDDVDDNDHARMRSSGTSNVVNDAKKKEEEEERRRRYRRENDDDDEEDAITEENDDDGEEEVLVGGTLERRNTPLTVSSSRTSPARSTASTLDGVGGGSASSSAVTVIPAERHETLSVLVSDVTKQANRAMEMLLRAEQERDSAVSSAAAADRAKKEVVADYDSRREQLEQDRLELEASIREKEVKLEWAIEEERNNTIILKQRCDSLRARSIASLEQELDALQCDHEEVVRSNVGKAAIVAELRSKVESADAKAKAEMKLLSKEIKSLRKEIKAKDKNAVAMQADLESAHDEVLLLRQAKEEAELSAKRNGYEDGIGYNSRENRASAAPHDTYSRLIQEVEVCRKKLNDCSFEELVKEEMSNDGVDVQGGGDAYGKPGGELNSNIDPESILSTSDARLDVCVMEANFIADNSFSNGSGGDHAGGDSIPATFASLLIENAKLRRSLNQMSRLAWGTQSAGGGDADTPGASSTASTSSSSFGARSGSMLATGKITDAMNWFVKSKSSTGQSPLAANDVGGSSTAML